VVVAGVVVVAVAVVVAGVPVVPVTTLNREGGRLACPFVVV
jgi:hypothetical protein